MLELVTFGPSSKIKCIPPGAFIETRIKCLSIPDSVVELCPSCFYGCRCLWSVKFGTSSKLERIGSYAFCCTSVESLTIPDSVLELCECCFLDCSLRSVTFSRSSVLARICAKAFTGTKIVSLSIPDSVVEVGKNCFARCSDFKEVTFGASSSLERIGAAYAGDTDVVESRCLPLHLATKCQLMD